MNRSLWIVLVVALFLPVLLGCQSAATAAQHNVSHTAQQQVSVPAESTAPVTRLTREDALDIALKDAKLTQDQIRDLNIELDRDNGKTHYDVDFEADGYDYEYEIHAKSGKILKSRKDRD